MLGNTDADINSQYAPVEHLTDSEEEEVECRICRLPAAPDEPLLHPCRCSGSVRFVHQACLDQWLKHSGRTFCEVSRNIFANK